MVRLRGAGAVALVPTMGAVHDGHAALVRAARKKCQRVVATVFVNPTQFGPSEDFAAYPRDEGSDAAKLEAAGAHLLYAPTMGEIYPNGEPLYDIATHYAATYGALIRTRYGEPFFTTEMMRVDDVGSLEVATF